MDYTYNANNELMTINGAPSFFYDDNGNTIRKAQGGQNTDFEYTIEDRLEQVKDDAGAVVAEFDESGVEIKSYGYKPGSIWTTDPLFMREGGEYYYYHNDHLGTPMMMTDVTGAVVWSARYGAFGEAEVDASPTVDRRKSGQPPAVTCYNVDQSSK